MARFVKSIIVLTVLAIAAALLSKKITVEHNTEHIDYTTFIEAARGGRIVSIVTIRGNTAWYRIKTPAAREPVAAKTQLPDPPDPNMYTWLIYAKVRVVNETSVLQGVWGNLLISLLPFLLILSFWTFMIRQMGRQSTKDDPMTLLRAIKNRIEQLPREKRPQRMINDPIEIRDIFESCGALLNGHFLLTSGLHSPQYLEKFQVLQHPELTTQLCAEIARRFKDANVQVVVGPATGGIILAHEVGRQLGVRAIFTEREGGMMTLRRGFQISEGERALVVEDIVTTGGSLQEVLDIVTNLGGQLVGVALLCDRSNGKLNLGVRTEALMTLNVAAYKPEECPQCKAGEPITERGSRHP